jgi:hypothetical protein
MEEKNQAVRTIKTPDGDLIKTFNGKFHCMDGPAIVRANGKKEYFINGFEYSEKDYKLALRDQKGVPPMKDPRFKTRY